MESPSSDIVKQMETKHQYMWIRKLPYDYYKHPSNFYESLMLWMNDTVYVMDNHLSAAWCWLQSCDPCKRYNFMHIDRHPDMTKITCKENLQPLCENPHMSYDDYTNLKHQDQGVCIGRKLIDWQNYIHIAYQLQPNWFRLFINIAKKHLPNNWDFDLNDTQVIIEDVNDLELKIDKYFVEYSECHKELSVEAFKIPWIVNLDLDVFYEEPHKRFCSDSDIRDIAKLLNRNLKNIQVLTIALSPTCLGGINLQDKWKNAFCILRTMSEEIECLKSFPFPKE